ncbi:MAG: spore coat protein CotJB [Clostridium sp.]|uniref:spore coat protein CotJB n=1 Tax=Clostridium sp. TaxID=1506 RepID=UPI00290DC03D|nr:spore coat protein CotJB [Clostridium sp.]MDU7337650.1 spore coat protein CotJB [Clostridium sp.]
MTDQERLMRQINSYRFMSWELHIFLDTHPNNCEAAKKLEETRKKIAELTKNYEDAYGPMGETSNQTSRWAWITGPWPWEVEEEVDN